jgi:hypothetical protein
MLDLLDGKSDAAETGIESGTEIEPSKRLQ